VLEQLLAKLDVSVDVPTNGQGRMIRRLEFNGRRDLSEKMTRAPSRRISQPIARPTEMQKVVVERHSGYQGLRCLGRQSLTMHMDLLDQEGIYCPCFLALIGIQNRVLQVLAKFPEEWSISGAGMPGLRTTALCLDLRWELAWKLGMRSCRDKKLFNLNGQTASFSPLTRPGQSIS
jgi:hypothetical protein